MLVYDLGGGTFDASLVRIRGLAHSVVSTEGISTLGGDDFDDVLAEMALDAVGADEQVRDRDVAGRVVPPARGVPAEERGDPSELAQDRLGSRVGARGVERRRGPGGGLLQTAALRSPKRRYTLSRIVLARNGFSRDGAGEDRKIESVYVAGGGSELPMIPRGLREIFGRRVKRSAHGRSSTAIGLAIQADAEKGYVLRDRFTRYFGVYREEDHGRRISFDPLFSKETPLPSAGEEPLRIARSYSPAHNVGHFRYLECSRLTGEGEPSGEITLWDDILFPFEPGLADTADLSAVGVERSPAAAGQVIEEAYSCDAGGRLAVKISNLSSRYGHDFALGRWAASHKRVKPGRAAQAPQTAAQDGPGPLTLSRASQAAAFCYSLSFRADRRLPSHRPVRRRLPGGVLRHRHLGPAPHPYDL